MKRHYREDNNYNPDKNVNYEEIIRVLRHTELPASDPIHRQGWVQNGTFPLLNVLGNKVWIFLCKN